MKLLDLQALVQRMSIEAKADNPEVFFQLDDRATTICTLEVTGKLAGYRADPGWEKKGLTEGDFVLPLVPTR